MNAQLDRQHTLEEYFALEEQSEIRHEYDGRRVYAMTGASRQHNRIVMRTSATLFNQLRPGSCEVYPSDMRLKVERYGIYTYPDLSVVCGPMELTGDRLDTMTNPTLLIEVLSPSTERYDRGRKFEYYRSIESLRAYLLIAQDRPHAELYLRRADNTWLLIDFHGLDQAIPLEAIGCSLALADLYADVAFDEEPQP